MAKRGRYQTAVGQKQVIPGSKEENFQGQNTWAGLGDETTQADPYFYSYSHFGIHEEMIKDTIRTETYMKAIIQNPELFRGKVVLDVGCGTGILSIFASRAGAAHVYGIDAAEVALQARQIVEDNGLTEKVTIIKGKVEEVQLPVGQVDIIISEWMGYFLLYESMLESLIFARDKWLAPDGIMLPDTAKLYLVGVEDAEYKESKVDFWDSVYGVNMSMIKPLVVTEPIVDVVEAHAIATNETLVYSMDLKTVRNEETQFAAEYSLTAIKNENLHALVAWFDVEFNHGSKKFRISTGPTKRYTHWKQTVFYLHEVLPMMSGEVLKGSLAVRKNPKHNRDIDIKISYHFDGVKWSYHDALYYKLK